MLLNGSARVDCATLPPPATHHPHIDYLRRNARQEQGVRRGSAGAGEDQATALRFCQCSGQAPTEATRPVVPITCGAVPVGIVIVACGTTPLTEVAVLSIAGILIGEAMTATSLSGRRTLDELGLRHGEYEAALALGFLPRDAVLEVFRPTAGQALVPALDQARTVGSVTLPGAFVGALLGGRSAEQAGATQLLVLIALLAAESIAVCLTIELVANGSLRQPSVTADR